MRMSDWSSDVCSSDLKSSFSPYFFGFSFPAIHLRASMRSCERLMASPFSTHFSSSPTLRSIQSLDRKSVVEGKSVSVRVDLGGRRLINKKNTTYNSCQY